MHIQMRIYQQDDSGSKHNNNATYKLSFAISPVSLFRNDLMFSIWL